MKNILITLLLVISITSCKKEQEEPPQHDTCDQIHSDVHNALVNIWQGYGSDSWQIENQLDFYYHYRTYMDMSLDAGCDTSGWSQEIIEIQDN